MQYGLIIILVSLALTAGFAAVRTVSSGSSIQTAIDAATTGDTIKVAAGTYNANLLINNKRLVLLGGYAAGFASRDVAANVTVIQGASATPALKLQNQSTSGSTIDGFTIRGGSHGVMFDQAVTWPHLRNITISNNIIENNGVTTENCGGVSLSGSGNLLTHNVIRFNFAGRGGALGGGDSNTISYNLVDSNLGHSDHGGGIYLGGHPIVTITSLNGTASAFLPDMAAGAGAALFSVTRPPPAVWAGPCRTISFTIITPSRAWAAVFSLTKPRTLPCIMSSFMATPPAAAAGCTRTRARPRPK
jgi:hypothetical protein